MKQFSVILMLVAFCLGVDCQGNLPTGLDVDIPRDVGPPCVTTYWDNEHAVGLSVPDDLIGPVKNPFKDTGASSVAWVWYPPGVNDVYDAAIIFTLSPTDETLEEMAAERAQQLGSFYQVVKNEPLTLNSGRPAWVIVKKLWDRPDITMVEVMLVWNGVYYSLTTSSAYNYDEIIAIGRTMCAE